MKRMMKNTGRNRTDGQNPNVETLHPYVHPYARSRHETQFKPDHIYIYTQACADGHAQV